MDDLTRERVLAVLAAPLATRWFVNDLSTATGYGTDTLYPVLAELERDGLIASGWAPPFGDAPRRRYYTLRDGIQQAAEEAQR